MAKALQADGHRCMVCRQGREVIEMVHTFQFDCVVLSTKLPDVSGLAVAQRLRRPHGRPHLVLIGDEPRAEHQSSLRSGLVDDYLERPDHLDQLTLLVRRAFQPIPPTASLPSADRPAR